MKTILITLILLISCLITQAQDISKNALGLLRLGDNDGFGGEISYHYSYLQTSDRS